MILMIFAKSNVMDRSITSLNKEVSWKWYQAIGITFNIDFNMIQLNFNNKRTENENNTINNARLS